MPAKRLFHSLFEYRPIYRVASAIPHPSVIFYAGLLGLTGAVSAAAGGASAGTLLVANKGEHTLSLIDPATGSQLAAVEEAGVTGHEVAASPDGNWAFVPIYGNAGVGSPGTDGRMIRVIDLKRRMLDDTIDFGKGVRPHCAVFGPKDGLLYVTTELENAVAVIDPKSREIVGSIPTGMPESHMLAIANYGGRGYTANVASGTVSVLDLVARKLITTIPVCEVAQRIAISADDRWVFTADQRQPRLAVIDTTTNRVLKFIALPATAYGTACTPDNHWLIAALPSIGKVGVIDLEKMALALTVDVPKSPQEVLIRPDGAVAYVSCSASQKVAVIDVRTWMVQKLISAGRGADGLAWATDRSAQP